MRRLLVTLLLALSSVVLTQMPAHACSCVKNDTVQKQVKRADVVFAGRFNDGSFAADTLWKGDLVSKDVRVLSPGKSCGLDLKADRRYLVFALAFAELMAVPSPAVLEGIEIGALAARRTRRPGLPSDVTPLRTMWRRSVCTVCGDVEARITSRVLITTRRIRCSSSRRTRPPPRPLPIAWLP